uniref:Putative secreted protein n=1 Tax=Ixodes ricinus TaxID=34613 RepID=A0A6B0U7Q0_IXORI
MRSTERFPLFDAAAGAPFCLAAGAAGDAYSSSDDMASVDKDRAERVRNAARSWRRVAKLASLGDTQARRQTGTRGSLIARPTS